MSNGSHEGGNMPKVMLRKGTAGQLVFYIAKKDLEDEVVSLQFDQPDKWGGRTRTEGRLQVFSGAIARAAAASRDGAGSKNLATVEPR